MQLMKRQEYKNGVIQSNNEMQNAVYITLLEGTIYGAVWNDAGNGASLNITDDEKQ